MEVYFIRHTTPLVHKGICYGQTNLELAPSFRKEQEKVIKELPTSFDIVYSSPLKRCLHLARKLNGKEFLVDDRLMEIDFGDWEMKPWGTLPGEELETWMADYVNNAPPGGESMLALQQRVLAWWSELEPPTYGKMAVVTHGGIIRTMNAHLNNLPLSEAFTKFQIPYGGIAVFKV